VYFVKLDKAGNVYFVGQTNGAYPVSIGVYSNPNSGQFIAKVTPNLSSHIYSTVFGNGNGAPNISPTAFLVDTCENVYVAGWGASSGSFGAFSSDISNMPLTPDALQSTTDGTDFYFFVVNKNAQNLLYGSYFGGNGAIEHVDGGTSRFDKRGVMYEAICAACGGNSLTPTSPGVWSPTNHSSNCNLLGLKIAFNLAGTHVQVDAHPRATGCVPLTVQFSSLGSTTQNLHWYFDDGASSTLANPLHTFIDTGNFHVMLTGYDSTACNITDTAYIDVFVRDDSLVANFNPSIGVNCDSNLVTFTSHNYPSTTYFWTLGDGTFSTGDSIIHSYPGPGTYNITLVITDTTKCSLRDTFTNSITILPRVRAQFTMSDSSGCIPLTVNFNGQANATAHYAWDFGDGGTANIAAPSHTYTTADTFRVQMIMIDSASCNIADTAYSRVITIDSSADGDFIFSRIFYSCDSVRVTAWSTYVGEEAELWDFGDGTQSTSDSVTHLYTNGGTYTIIHVITDTDVVCRELDTARIVISLQPLHISVSIPDAGGCLPFTGTFVGNSPLVTTDYLWTFGDSTSTMGDSVLHTYNVTGVFPVIVVAIDTNACIQTDTAFGQITVIDDSVHADFQINVLNDCDSNLVISLANQSTNALQYNWSFGDGTFSTQQNENHTYHLAGTYTVTLIVTDTNRCHPVDTLSQDVTMLPNSNVDFTVLNACYGTQTQFHNLGNPNAQFFWNFGDGNSSTQYSPPYVYGSAGNYTVSLIMVDSTSCNVRDTAFHDVTVFEQPIADFTTTGDTFKFEKPVLFTNASQHYTHLFWDFGDGVTANDEESPVHTYETIYGMTICLMAMNDACADTICKDIYISFKGLVGVPNAFTPNGDGINDVVKIEGAGIVDLVFRIYNRWGEKVFETHDKNEGWDGIYKGELQEMDVFTYAADATLINEQVVHLKGNITLLR
jgi:gliding motility-associated-like protein